MKSNRSLALNLAGLAAAMVMLAYASVPLYRLFCQVTGFGGTTQQSKAAAPGAVSDRIITIRFNADIDPALPWKFAPSQPELKVKIGESELTHYVAENLTASPVSGHAVYNVLPFKAGSYFTKIACFCFTEQTLAAHQKVDMPVSFYLDPAMLADPEMADVHIITLSYTFFPVKTETKN